MRTEGKHQPELYLNVWLSAPPRPNPERNWSRISNAAGCTTAVLWRVGGKDLRLPPPSQTPGPSLPYLWVQTRQHSRGGCSRACHHAAGREVSISPCTLLAAPTLLHGCFPGTRPTSACPPDVRVLLHFSHRRQGRCQSFPREVTFSAAMQRDGLAKTLTKHKLFEAGWPPAASAREDERFGATFPALLAEGRSPASAKPKPAHSGAQTQTWGTTLPRALTLNVLAAPFEGRHCHRSDREDLDISPFQHQPAWR